MNPTITIVGNLAADPELRFTPQGKALVNFTVMTSRNTKSPEGVWESVDVTGWPCSAWDQLAENVAETLRKGDGVIIVGTVYSRSWQSKEGEQRSRVECNAQSVAADLKRVSASLNRLDRSQPVKDDPFATTSTVSLDW